MYVISAYLYIKYRKYKSKELSIVYLFDTKLDFIIL